MGFSSTGSSYFTLLPQGQQQQKASEKLSRCLQPLTQAANMAIPTRIATVIPTQAVILHTLLSMQVSQLLKDLAVSVPSSSLGMRLARSLAMYISMVE